MSTVDARPVLYLFSRMLDYPQADTRGDSAECANLLTGLAPEAIPFVESFERFLSAQPLGKVEEVYTSMFDMNVTHAPYIGYHLFGETYKRSSFMISLRERYANSGFFYDGIELPDHLAVLLQFLSVNKDAEVERSLVSESLLPALQKMVDAKPLDRSNFPKASEPYKDVERALLLVLQRVNAAWNPDQANAGGLNG